MTHFTWLIFLRVLRDLRGETLAKYRFSGLFLGDADGPGIEERIVAKYKYLTLSSPHSKVVQSRLTPVKTTLIPAIKDFLCVLSVLCGLVLLVFVWKAYP